MRRREATYIYIYIERERERRREREFTKYVNFIALHIWLSYLDTFKHFCNRCPRVKMAVAP